MVARERQVYDEEMKTAEKDSSPRTGHSMAPDACDKGKRESVFGPEMMDILGWS